MKSPGKDQLRGRVEQAPAMAQVLRELAVGASGEQLRRRAAQVLERIDAGRDREPGEDDE
jgi:hypothetical protein